MHGEDEDEEVVWHGLKVAVHGMEGVRGKWCRDYENDEHVQIRENWVETPTDPFMVQLMAVLVKRRVVL